MDTLLRRLRREDGIALPTVMGALALTVILSTTAFTIAVDGQQTSAADRDSKRASAAARAAVDYAFRRTAEVEPQPAQCVGNDAMAINATTGECDAYAVPAASGLGNGAAMEYVVGPEGAPGCRALPNDPRPVAARQRDRCITAKGTVNGQTSRVQTRILYIPPFRPWSQAGLIGRVKVEIGNNKTINSPIGSNGLVKIGNNSSATQVLLSQGPPAATSEFGNNANPGTVSQVPAWTFPQIDWDSPRQSNDNAKLDGLPGWNPTTQMIELTENAQSLTLDSGVYHLCGLKITGNGGASLNVLPGATVRLFVDSTRGNGDGANCPATSTGRVDLTGNNAFVNATDDRNPAELGLFVYGTTTDSTLPDVQVMNGTMLFGTIWAPDSTIVTQNNGLIEGAFTANIVDMKNNGGFVYSNSIVDMTLPGTGVARRRAYFECSAQRPVASDPESGCST